MKKRKIWEKAKINKINKQKTLQLRKTVFVIGVGACWGVGWGGHHPSTKKTWDDIQHLTKGGGLQSTIYSTQYLYASNN